MKKVSTDGRGSAGVGKIGAQIANAIAGPMIDAAVTPGFDATGPLLPALAWILGLGLLIAVTFHRTTPAR